MQPKKRRIVKARVLTENEYVEMMKEKDRKEKETEELKQKRKEEREKKRKEREKVQEEKRKCEREKRKRGRRQSKQKAMARSVLLQLVRRGQKYQKSMVVSLMVLV